MQFELREFLRAGRTPYHAVFESDFSQEDFDGFTAEVPVQCDFTATPVMDGAEMHMTLKATVRSECARCLAPVEESYEVERDYLVKPRDLDDPDFELPVNEEGCLDLTELAYQELIFAVPRVLLCSPDCQGLCPICGKKKGTECTCHQQTEEPAPKVDARLSILKQLLS